MKRIVGIAVVMCLMVLCVSPVPVAAAGSQQRSDVGTLDAQIMEWKADLARLMEDLYDPETIWIKLTDGSIIPVKEAALMKAIKMEQIEAFKRIAETSKDLGFIAALQDVQDVKRRQAAYRKKAYTDLVKEDETLRALQEQRAQNMRDLIRWLEQARTAALGPGPSVGGPDITTGRAEDIDSAKARLIAELDVVRKRENWDVRDHGVVKTRFEGARTIARLNQVLALQNDYSSCYQDWNAKNARIAAAAKAGRYRTPGDRIAEGDKALRDREECLKAAFARYEKAIF